VAWSWVRFKTPIKFKGLTGFVLGSCGFVLQVNSMSLNHLVGSFGRFGPSFSDRLFGGAHSVPPSDRFMQRKSRSPKSAVCATAAFGTG
jgi:hypothetical protein